VQLLGLDADGVVLEDLGVAAVRVAAAQLPHGEERVPVDVRDELVEREVYIPLGAPVRWSLVRASMRNYLANAWGFHPLFPLSQPTT
jgi:hypothetical protein